MKQITTAIFAACALMGAAQTLDSPQPIAMGENSCSVGSWSSAYFSYTAPEDQLVTLDGIGTPTVTCGDKEIPVAKNSTTERSVFAVKGNSEYVISTFTTTGDVQFTASATPHPYQDGTSCESPIAGSETEFFVPFFSEGGMWGTKVPVYISYTAATDGRLEMKFDGSVGTLAYSESCTGEYTSVDNGEYVDGGWMASFEVEADQSYIIRGTASTAMMASFKVVQPTPGASCGDAWTAKRGENEIPAESGSYWYGITTPAAPANCFIMLQSKSALPGGKVTLKASCTSSYGDIVMDEAIALRIPSGANAFRVLNIEKTESTPESEWFTLTFQDQQTYDNFATAEEIEADQTVTTPDFGGTYYYAIKAPEKGSVFLDLTAGTDVADGTTVELYDKEKDYMDLARGTDRLHYEVTPGTTYVIKWTCPNTMHSLPFKVTFNPVKPGETEANPLEATLGMNSVPTSAAVYFSYTAATDSWLVVKPTGVNLPRIYSVDDDGWKSIVSTYDVDNGEAVKFEATNGTRYLLTFENIAENASFELSEQAYAEGETASNPIVVDGNVITLPETAGKTWFSHPLKENGILEITTTLKYDYSNSIIVYLNEVNDGNRQTMSAESYGSENYAMLSMTVRKDDAVYVCVNTTNAQPQATINFNMRQPEPGETPENPIAIDFTTNPMDYRFDKTVGYGDSPVWYSINLTQQIFDMTSEGSFSMSMYAAGNTETAIATSGGSMFGPNYLKNVVINTPGTYLLKLTSASAAFDVTFSEREANEGEVPAKAYLIQPTEVPYAMTFAQVAYGSMPVWYAINLVEGDFNLVQSETATAALYKEGDYTTPVARLAYSFSNDNYAIDNYEVTAAGKYYYCIESSYSDCNATLSGSAISLMSGLESGVADNGLTVTAVAGGVSVTATDCEVRIHAADGRTVATQHIDGQATIALPHGIYVVTAGGNAVKVAVK